MKAPTSGEACELPPDLNIKLHASQSYSETRFVHILQGIYHQRYVYCVTFYCVFIRLLFEVFFFSHDDVKVKGN